MDFLKNHYRTVLIVFFILMLTIVFQTLQQVYYIERFQIGKNVKFIDVLSNQFYRWLIWFFIGFSLPFIVKKDIQKDKTFRLFLKHFGIVLLLVLTNILIVSLLQSSTSPDPVSFTTFFREYFSFYLFQKAPMYTLGYLAIVVILFLNFENKKLIIEVKELIEVKNANEFAYEKWSNGESGQTKVLSIKIGNKLKVIPISEIIWVEANDYCVIVHSINEMSYSMRASLKSLENKLPSHFMRVHRKGIVNMKMVKEFQNFEGNSSIVTSSNDFIPVSKVNIKAVKMYLQHTV